MSGSRLEALPDVQEWSGGPPGCPGVVDKPSRKSGSGREASRISGSCRQTLPDVREWSTSRHGCSGVVDKPSRMSGSGRKALPEVWEW